MTPCAGRPCHPAWRRVRDARCVATPTV